MASIRKRGESWQVQVRKQGHLSQTKTFTHKAFALAWARKIESEVERGLIGSSFQRPVMISLKEAIERYIDLFSSRKKSCVQESNRLRKLARLPLAKIAVANITSEDIAKLRDRRLLEVRSQATRHDLNALSQVFTIAMREWDLGLVKNPVSTVWKLKFPRFRGHPNICVPGVGNGQKARTVHA